MTFSFLVLLQSRSRVCLLFLIELCIHFRRNFILVGNELSFPKCRFQCPRANVRKGLLNSLERLQLTCKKIHRGWYRPWQMGAALKGFWTYSDLAFTSVTRFQLARTLHVFVFGRMKPCFATGKEWSHGSKTASNVRQYGRLKPN